MSCNQAARLSARTDSGISFPSLRNTHQHIVIVLYSKTSLVQAKAAAFICIQNISALLLRE